MDSTIKTMKWKSSKFSTRDYKAKMIRPAAGGALWENWNFLAERDRKREWRETKVLLFSKILKSVFKWDLKVGFTQGERQFPEINPFKRRSHTFKKGKSLVGKGNNQSLFGFYFGRLGSLFPEGANAAFDFKPCKLYCQTEISQNMRGNDFAIKCPLLVAVIFLKHRYINQKKHTMLTMRGKNSLSQKQTNKQNCKSHMMNVFQVVPRNSNPSAQQQWETPCACPASPAVHWLPPWKARPFTAKNLLVFHSSTTGYQDFAK